MPTSRSTRGTLTLALSGAALIVAVLGPRSAHAALGETEASVQADVAQLHGSLKISDRIGYRLHEIRLPSGTLVREFASPGGNVFAVAWSGPTVPNLRGFFGRYFDDFVAAAKLKHADHRHLQLQRNDLVIEASGHMRAFSGRAYLPQGVPAGVNLGDLH